ncbi:MAG: hypothetical protein KGR26_15245, partial [Cyanobacteria bacterium REEB65]|nr:hypothetical protein [Cyanobacteria bacterium REEB65]
MTHAQNILAILDAQRCSVCGHQAVRGSTICLDCAEREPLPDNTCESEPPAAEDFSSRQRSCLAT